MRVYLFTWWASVTRASAVTRTRSAMFVSCFSLSFEPVLLTWPLAGLGVGCLTDTSELLVIGFTEECSAFAHEVAVTRAESSLVTVAAAHVNP